MSPDVNAVLFLLLISGALLGWAVSAVYHSPFTLAQTCLFVTATLLVRLLWRAELPGDLPFKRGEGAVLVSNHRCSLDPFFIQVCADRPTHYMVTRESYEHPAFHWFLSTVEAIPTNRSGIDTRATKMAIRYASQGGYVGMFPEGRINLTDDFMMSVRPGAVLVALRAGVPILPICILGAPYAGTEWSPLFMPARVRIRWGEPIDLSEYHDRDADNQVIGDLMRRVVREVARLAGEDDFEPQLAGRRWLPSEEEQRTHARDAERRSREKAAT